jgi:hypothetical protein
MTANSPKVRAAVFVDNHKLGIQYEPPATRVSASRTSGKAAAIERPQRDKRWDVEA